MTAPAAPARVRAGPLVAAGLVFASLNLRASIAAVAPVLTQIERTDGLSSAGAGVLSAAPIVCFGAFAFATPALLRRLDATRLLWLAVAGVAAGTGLRSVRGSPALFGGTLLLGAAIGVGNVVLPTLVKREFPHRVALMTGLYAMSLSAGAAAAAGATVPLEHLGGLSWRAALACWALPALAALVLWSPRRARGHPDAPTAARGSAPSPPAPGERARRDGIHRSSLAWAVTGTMGLQSLEFYALFAFVPNLLEGAGMPATTAGALLAGSQVVSVLAALLTPWLVRRLRRPAWGVAGAVALNAVALAGLAAHPRGVVAVAVWMVAMGSAQGSILSQALGFIVLRSADPTRAAGLSTMAQGVGYLVASIGPLTMGALHQLTGGWVAPLATLGGLLLVELGAGVVAAQDRVLGAGGAGPVP